MGGAQHERRAAVARMIVFGIDPGATTGWAVADITARRLALWGSLDTRTSIRALREVMRDALHEHDRLLFAVELIRGHAHRKEGATSSKAASKGLIECGRVEGRILEALDVLGQDPITFAAADWRQALIGERGPSDRRIAQVLGLRWPELRRARTNVHVRDALGVAEYGGLTCEHARRMARGGDER